MINTAVLTGRLTRDPELRVSQNDVQICNFTLAVNRPFKDRNGENQADFINCVAFRKQAELIKQYVSKGDLFGIEGRQQSRSYENKEGQRVYVTETVVEKITFLESNKNNNTNNNQSNYNQSNYGQGNYNQGNNQSNNNNPFNNSTGNVTITPDDLPF